MTMDDHHIRTIEKVKVHFERDPNVQALLLSGSIAHGFAAPNSDVDILIILSEEAYENLVETGSRLTYVTEEFCDYPGGYIDGKYISLSFIRRVAAKGNEPSRWAFDGAQILFSRVNGLEDLLRQVTAYPVAEKKKRIISFRAQLEGWNWYCSEARKKNNPYLLAVAVGKLVLFGGRLILVHNEMLYPFHKWLLKVLEKVPDKPVRFVELAEKVSREPTAENVESFYQVVKNFQEWDESPNGWGSQYMLDVELTWMDGRTPVDDL